MKRLHKKILIVIRLKIVEILIALGCVAIAYIILYSLNWLIGSLGIVRLLETVLGWAVIGIVILVFLSAIGASVVCWFKWNWDKAEKIIERKE